MIRYVNAYIIYTCIHYLDLSTLRRLSMNSESITSINIDMYRIHQGFFTYPTYRKCKKSIQFIQLYSSYSEGVIQYIYIQYVTYIHIHTYTLTTLLLLLRLRLQSVLVVYVSGQGQPNRTSDQYFCMDGSIFTLTTRPPPPPPSPRRRSLSLSPSSPMRYLMK